MCVCVCILFIECCFRIVKALKDQKSLKEFKLLWKVINTYIIMNYYYFFIESK